MVQPLRHARCACGKVQFEAEGAPILASVCYCSDCQAGGRMIEALPKAAPVLDPDGGASLMVYRDDRIRCIAGQELLKGYKLKPDSPTTRYVATCCNSGMYLKFKPGHWVSAYRKRFDEAGLPPVEMRTNLRRRTSDAAFEDNAPRYQKFPIRLFTKLIGARIGMALGR